MGKRELPEQLQFLASRRAVQRTTDASMKGKVCVVAGSTSGVGLQAARRIARAGADIVMVCRDRARAEPIRDDLVRFGVELGIGATDVDPGQNDGEKNDADAHRDADGHHRARALPLLCRPRRPDHRLI